jgi:hypothetical protein
MDSLPKQPSTRDKGYDLLLRNLKDSRNSRNAPASPKIQTKIPLEFVPLEMLQEQGIEPEDIADDEDYTWASLKNWFKRMPVEQRNKFMCSMRAEDLSTLVRALEGLTDKATEALGKNKYMTIRTMTRIIWHLQTAIERGKEFTKVSDYLHVMQIREQARTRKRRASNRAIARLLKVDESKIRRWDERAKKLGVTLEDWDFERLQQIVRPPRRAPP